MAQKISKAKIVISGEVIEFPFNPTQFTKSVGVKYSETMGAGANLPIVSYAGGNTPSIDVEAYINARSEGHDLKHFIGMLQGALPWETGKPPWNSPPEKLLFVYGWFVKECYLTKLDIDYTMFNKILEPIEAKVKMSLLIHADVDWFAGGKKRLDISY